MNAYNLLTHLATTLPTHQELKHLNNFATLNPFISDVNFIRWTEAALESIIRRVYNTQ